MGWHTHIHSSYRFILLLQRQQYWKPGRKGTKGEGPEIGDSNLPFYISPLKFSFIPLVNSIDHKVFPIRATVSKLGKHQNKVHRKFFESISRSTEPQPLPYKCFTMSSCFHTFVHLFNIYWRSTIVTVNAVPALRLLIDQSIKLDETV